MTRGPLAAVLEDVPPPDEPTDGDPYGEEWAGDGEATGAGLQPLDAEEGGPPSSGNALVDMEVEKQYAQLKGRQIAQARLVAENAPPLRLLSLTEMLEEPGAEPLIPGLFYVDSLSRVYGPPGGGKSLVLLDICLRAALDWTWSGIPFTCGPIIYIAAEGQRVNRDRTLAWLDYHAVHPDDRVRVARRFQTVPDAVILSEEAARPFLAVVARVRPSLVIIDTKNACQPPDADENSASDFAAMRLVLDQIRKTCDACVVLVDHTGYDGARARGTSAATGGMDTEIRVREEPEGGPIVVQVTRDKSGGPGFARDFRIHVHYTPGLDEHTAHQPIALPAGMVDDEHRTLGTTAATVNAVPDVEVPREVLDYKGQGAAAIVEVARFMAANATVADGVDPAGIGVSRAEAQRVLCAKAGRQEAAIAPMTLHRAWSALRSQGYLTSSGSGRGNTGRCVWRDPPEPPDDNGGEVAGPEPEAPESPTTTPPTNRRRRSRGRSRGRSS